MKKAEREIYRVLADEIDGSLCAFCKFAEGEGNCGEWYAVCVHPLNLQGRVGEEELTPGDDCWGFRPNMPVSDIADIAGIILREGYLEWGWRLEDGQIIVSGRGKKELSLR